ncbi:MAG: alginate lyase family protein [Acidobacteria bacterium]|nr:alginate lyase family protein [Acidobacteriota bacterium]
MISSWRRTCARLSQMSGDEISTRLCQAVMKPLDLMAAKLGHDFSRVGSGSKTRGKFFFKPEELSDRIRLLKELVPQEVALTVCAAEEVCRHRLQLLGYTIDYGSEIDWHTDAVHGKRAPLKPAYKIRYLDFDEVGDHKVTWELNRHQHLVTLAKAWRFADERRVLSELLNQWYSWQRSNPYPLGINWSSSLEVALRSLSWLWVANLLAPSDPVPENFRSDLVAGLGLHGRHIECYLSRYFSPNTHLLGEAVALLFIGAGCPELEPAERWKITGWELVLEAAERQVRSDGVYFEQALHYHVYAVDLFLHARILAANAGLAIPLAFDAVIERMLEVIESISQAGPAEGFGDDDGGRLFNPQRNRSEHMTDPLALGAALYGRAQISSAAPLTEESIWLLGKRATEPVAEHKRPLGSKAFEAGGIYVMVSPSPSPQLMAIDAGPQGIGRCGHGHADALSVRLSVSGHRCLIDSGTGAYVCDTGDRNLFRGTAAHNTLRVDGQDQAVADGYFAWREPAHAECERWVKGDSFDFLAANHRGYRRLVDPVLHRRFIFNGKDGLWLVRDACEGHALHRLETFWHFAEEISLVQDDDAVVAVCDSAIFLVLYCAPARLWQKQIASSFVSPAYGQKNIAPLLTTSASLHLPVECGTLLVTGQPDSRGRFSAAGGQQSRNVSAYRYETGTADHLFFFAQQPGTWSLEPWSSDAEFMYCRSEGGQITRLILVAGRWAKMSDTVLVSHSRSVERWEWARRAGAVTTSSSDQEALEHLLGNEHEALGRIG